MLPAESPKARHMQEGEMSSAEGSVSSVLSWWTVIVEGVTKPWRLMNWN